MDYGIIVILAIPVITGFCKGFIKTVFGFLGMIGGLVLSIAFARPLGNSIGDLFDLSESILIKIAAFLIIFTLCGMCGFLGSWIFRRMVRMANLGFLDRLLGGVLGLLQGSVITGVLLIIVCLLPVSQSWVENSLLAKQIVKYSTGSVNALPDEWIEYLSPQRWIGNSEFVLPKIFNQEQERKSEEKNEEINPDFQSH